MSGKKWREWVIVDPTDNSGLYVKEYNRERLLAVNETLVVEHAALEAKEAEIKELLVVLEAYASIDDNLKIPAMRDGTCMISVNSLAKLVLENKNKTMGS